MILSTKTTPKNNILKFEIQIEKTYIFKIAIFRYSYGMVFVLYFMKLSDGRGFWNLLISSNYKIILQLKNTLTRDVFLPTFMLFLSALWIQFFFSNNKIIWHFSCEHESDCSRIMSWNSCVLSSRTERILLDPRGYHKLRYEVV